MTPSEIVALQARNRRLFESSRTIVGRLRAPGAAGDPTLVAEAADVIEFLRKREAQLQQDLKDEARESSRSAAAAYADGRHDAMDDGRGW